LTVTGVETEPPQLACPLAATVTAPAFAQVCVKVAGNDVLA
jgi:hypothetical protein